MRRAALVAVMLALTGPLRVFAEGPPPLPTLKSGRAHITEEVKSGGKVWVTALFWVDADQEATFRILRDIERHPEFMPQVRATRILSAGQGYHVVHIEAGEGVLASAYTLRRTWDATRRISWTLVEGRPREVTGFWEVARPSEGGGSLVTYSAYINIGGLVPDFVTRYVVKQTVPVMVTNVRKRAESGGVWQSDEYRHRQ